MTEECCQEPQESAGEVLEACERAMRRMEGKAQEWEGGLQDRGRALSYRAAAEMLRAELGTLGQHPRSGSAGDDGLERVLVPKDIQGLTLTEFPALKDSETGELFFSPDALQVANTLAQALAARQPQPAPELGEADMTTEQQFCECEGFKHAVRMGVIKEGTHQFYNVKTRALRQVQYYYLGPKDVRRSLIFQYCPACGKPVKVNHDFYSTPGLFKEEAQP